MPIIDKMPNATRQLVRALLEEHFTWLKEDVLLAMVNRSSGEAKKISDIYLALSIRGDSTPVGRGLKLPKDVHEGTLNHVKMILNACQSGDCREAAYLTDDLIDELTCRSLVITKRVAPLDEDAIEKMRREAFERGLLEGQQAAHVGAHREMRKKLKEALKEVLG